MSNSMSSTDTVFENGFVYDKKPIHLIVDENGTLSWEPANVKIAKGKRNQISLDYVLATEICEKAGEQFLKIASVVNAKRDLKIQNHSFYSERAEKLALLKEFVEKKIEESVRKPPKRLYVLINPESGRRKGLKIYETYAAPIFKLAGITTQIKVTERPNHAKDLLSDFSQDVDGIVCVGGDGTITECMCGLILAAMKDDNKSIDDKEEQVSATKCKIGIIPAGTGQGYIMGAVGSKDPTSAAIAIALGDIKSANMYSVHNNNVLVSYGGLVMGYGFFGDSIKLSEAHRNYGMMRYPYAMIKTFRKKKKFTAQVEYVEATGEPSEQNPNGAEKWIRKDEDLFDLHHYVVDMTIGATTPDYLNVHLVGAPSLSTYSKHLYRLSSLRSDSFDLETFQNFNASQYRFHIENFPTALNLSPEEGEKFASPCINIDGDSFPLSAADVDIKLLPRVVTFFGRATQKFHLL